MLHPFLINNFMMPGTVNFLLVHYTNGCVCVISILHRDFFEIIEWNGCPMYDTYMNWLILIITHEILMVCSNRFSLALLFYFIVSSNLSQKNPKISCFYIIPSISSLPAFLRSNLKRSNRWEYLYMLMWRKMSILKTYKSSW